MVEDHAGLNNERISEVAFLDQCEIAWREREAMMHRRARVVRRGLFYCLFDTPDRIQHLFWRFREPDHPANRGMAPDPDFCQVIDDAYRRCDAIVGKALELRDDDDAGHRAVRPRIQQLPARRSSEHLAVRPRLPGPARRGHGPARRPATCLRQVDWERTRAYALGLGGIYLNLEGREGQGIVAAEDAEALKAELAGGLAGLTDPGRGGRLAIRRVHAARGRSIAAPISAKRPTWSSTSRRATASRGRRRWEASPRVSSRTTSRSGAAITSSIPIMCPACCS